MTDKDKKFKDDDRIVADMSALAPKRPLFMPSSDVREEEEIPAHEAQRGKVSKEERGSLIKGALSASLAIWLVYIVVFGVVIYLMTKLI